MTDAASRSYESALRSLVGALEASEVSRRLLRGALRVSGARAGCVVLRAADGSEQVVAQSGPKRGLETAARARIGLRAGGTLLGELRLRGPRPRSAVARRRLSCLCAAAASALDAARTHAAALRRAELDPLTGLANRGRLWEALEHEVTRAERYGRALALVMFDIDGLKRVNDRLGHLAGDDALVAIGRLVRERSRSTDIAARYGGDEFALVLPETPMAGALAVAEKIRASAQEIGAQPYGVTLSAGVASVPDDGRSASELVAAADSRLYAAKAAGGNQVAGES